MFVRKKKSYSRKDVTDELIQLALCPLNDAVKLSYLAAPTDAELKALDLRALSEFKRGASGAVELKFIDRQKLFEALLLQMDGGEREQAEIFLRALEDPKDRA